MSGYTAAGAPPPEAGHVAQAQPDPVPEATASVARAVFRKGNPLVSLRDEVGAILADTDFADLFPKLEASNYRSNSAQRAAHRH
jgi:hypothetical protein